MKVLLLDNYDSFTYNLLHILKELNADVDVYRNDQITLDQVAEYGKILLSPGPGVPSEAGIMIPLIQRYAKEKSILGVCLGEQAIGEAFGAKILNLTEVFHGICSNIRVINNDYLFDGLGSIFKAGRYHSWVVSKEDFPSCLEITCTDEDKGLIMAIRHKTYDVRGIQFHPESILTPQGKTIITNWLNNK